LLRVERGNGPRIVTRCCRRSCSNCCAHGGGSVGGATCCCREVAYSPADPIAPLSASQLCRAVRAAAQAAGMSPHTLRHSFTTRLLEQDVGIRVIHTLLGHANSTPRYRQHVWVWPISG
jgi:hypothetical protein